MAHTITETELGRMLEKRLQKAMEYSRYKERGLSSNPFNIDYTGNSVVVPVIQRIAENMRIVLDGGRINPQTSLN